MKPENIAFPRTPGLYGAQWLGQQFGGNLWTVRDDVLPYVPEGLQADVAGFQTISRLGMIGAPYAQMADPTLKSSHRGTRLHEAHVRSAHIMALMGMVATTATGYTPDELHSTTFFDDLHNVLIDGTEPAPAPVESREALIAQYAKTLHTELGFNARPVWAGHVSGLFSKVNLAFRDQMVESAKERLDADRLLKTAARAGGACAEIAATVAAQPQDLEEFARFGKAAHAFGAMGFLEDQGTNVIHDRMETYTSALLRRGMSVASLREAQTMRQQAERKLYNEGLAGLNPGRERNIFKSQVWFSLNVYGAQRVFKGLWGKRPLRAFNNILDSFEEADARRTGH